ncbi:hypothetical protein HOC13_04285 [Candidatus Woesearchaeota archaeon]|jgi:hypothetical protein|nr:hypothetical protein [Candidatus Woesearchaeota archaeon]
MISRLGFPIKSGIYQPPNAGQFREEIDQLQRCCERNEEWPVDKPLLVEELTAVVGDDLGVSISRIPGTTEFGFDNGKSYSIGLDPKIAIIASMALLDYSLSVGEIVDQNLLAWIPADRVPDNREFESERELETYLSGLNHNPQIKGVRSFDLGWMTEVENLFYVKGRTGRENCLDYLVNGDVVYLEVNPFDRTKVNLIPC